MKARWLLFFLLWLAPSLAAAGATGEGAEAFHFNWLGFFGQVFNSTVLFGGIIYLLRKPLIEFMSKRSLAIKDDILHRQEEIQHSVQKLQEVGQRVERIESEIEAIKTAAEDDGRQERERLEKLALAEVERIVAFSEAEIQQRVDASVRRLKEKIVDQTLIEFRREMEKYLDEAAQRNIIEKNIKSCGDLDEGE